MNHPKYLLQISIIVLLALSIFLSAAACSPSLGAESSPTPVPEHHAPAPVAPSAPEDSPETPTGTTYFISPDGNDSACGLSDTTPWRSFSHALTILHPGDMLLLMDGLYTEALHPTISGEPGAPIIFRAMHRGKATIEPAAETSAILVFSSTSHTTSYLVFDGLITRGHGEDPTIWLGSNDNVPEAQMTHHITVRNTGVYGTANMSNSVAFALGNNLRDSLVEDIWAYGFGRKALQAFGSLRLTIRRAVLRYDYWDGSGYKPNDPRLAFSGYNTQYSTFENIIAIDGAPPPPDREPDMSGFAASGNETPAIVSGSAYNKYLGMMALDVYGNGLEVNGGSGDPTHDIVFRDIIIWNPHRQAEGINVQGNDNGSNFSYVTVNGAENVGFRVDPYPHAPISNESVTHVLVLNSRFGYYYDPAALATFQDNSSVNIVEDDDIEPQYAPTVNYIVRPEMQAGHERGAMMVKRYVDGELTTQDLWPWPNEDLIRQHMCNPADLAATHRVAANGPGWEPAWCASGKSLTRYIWEYLGHPIPNNIYGTQSTYLPLITITNANGGGNARTLTNPQQMRLPASGNLGIVKQLCKIDTSSILCRDSYDLEL